MNTTLQVAIESVLWAVVMLVVLIVGVNAGEKNARREADAAYQQGYKDALYKRPVSNDLEMVCAGLWIGEQNKKYQEMEMKRGH